MCFASFTRFRGAPRLRRIDVRDRLVVAQRLQRRTPCLRVGGVGQRHRDQPGAGATAQAGEDFFDAALLAGAAQHFAHVPGGISSSAWGRP